MTMYQGRRYEDTLSFAGFREALEEDEGPGPLEPRSGPMSEGIARKVPTEVPVCTPLEMPDQSLSWDMRPSMKHAPSSGSHALFSPEGPELSSWYPHSPCEEGVATEGPDSMSWKTSSRGAGSPVSVNVSGSNPGNFEIPIEVGRAETSEPEVLDGSDVLQQISNLTSTQPSNEREVFVGGLRESDDAVHITEEELATYFSKFGVIESVSINRDDRTHRGRGFAFVKFFQESAALNAVVADASTHVIRSVTVSVQWSRGAKDVSGDRQRRRNSGNSSANLSESGSKSSSYGFPTGHKRQRGVSAGGGGGTGNGNTGVNGGTRSINTCNTGGGKGSGVGPGNGNGSGVGVSTPRSYSPSHLHGGSSHGHGTHSHSSHSHNHSPNGISYGLGYNYHHNINSTPATASGIQRGGAGGVSMVGVVIVPAQRVAALGLQTHHTYNSCHQRQVLARGGGEGLRGSPLGDELHFIPLTPSHSAHSRRSPPPSLQQGGVDNYAQEKYGPYAPEHSSHDYRGKCFPSSMPRAILGGNQQRSRGERHPHHQQLSPVTCEYNPSHDVIPSGLYSPPAMPWNGSEGSVTAQRGGVGIGSPPGHRSPMTVSMTSRHAANGGGHVQPPQAHPGFVSHGLTAGHTMGSPQGYRSHVHTVREDYISGVEGNGGNGSGFNLGGKLLSGKYGRLHGSFPDPVPRFRHVSPDMHLSNYDYDFVGTSHRS